MITTGLTNGIKQVAADAACPVSSVLKIALFRVGAIGDYDKNFNTAYVVGMVGDECPTANGYTQGGQELIDRKGGPSFTHGFVGYADAVWMAVGVLSAIGAVIYDSTQGNRIVGFVDFGGTKTAVDALFTVRIPGDGGEGLVRIA